MWRISAYPAVCDLNRARGVAVLGVLLLRIVCRAFRDPLPPPNHSNIPNNVMAKRGHLQGLSDLAEIVIGAIRRK